MIESFIATVLLVPNTLKKTGFQHQAVRTVYVYMYIRIIIDDGDSRGDSWAAIFFVELLACTAGWPQPASANLWTKFPLAWALPKGWRGSMWVGTILGRFGEPIGSHMTGISWMSTIFSEAMWMLITKFCKHIFYIACLLRRTCYMTVSSSSFPPSKSWYMLVACVGVLRCCPSLLWCFASSLAWQPVPSMHLIHSIQLPTRRERQSPGETFGANSMRSCGDLKPHGFSCRSFYLLWFVGRPLQVQTLAWRIYLAGFAIVQPSTPEISWKQLMLT